MTIPATSALAVPFDFTGDTFDLSVTFTSGSPSTVTCTVPAGTYRISLAPASSDFLRVLQSRMNAALATATRAETCTVSVSQGGVCTIAFSVTVDEIAVSSQLAAVLGFAADVIASSASSATASHPVRYLALFSELNGGMWLARQAGGAETTTGGVSYALAAAHTWYECTHTAGFVPWTPTFAAAWSSEATPLYPEEQYLTSLGLTSALRGWSLLDVFAVARNTLCAVALGTWRTARTDTGARIVRAYVGPSTILSPQTERLDAAWDGFASLPLHLTRPSSGDTETRA